MKFSNKLLAITSTVVVAASFASFTNAFQPILPSSDSIMNTCNKSGTSVVTSGRSMQPLAVRKDPTPLPKHRSDTSALKRNLGRVGGDHHLVHDGTKLAIGSMTKEVKDKKKYRPRVLFFPGAYTDAKTANFLLKMLRYDRIFDIVVVDGTHTAGAMPGLFRDTGITGIDTLVEKGLYDLEQNYSWWNAGLPEFAVAHMGEGKEVHTTNIEQDTFLDQNADYISSITEHFGSFDGVIGFCEGSAAAHAMISLQKSGRKDVGLDSVKFYIGIAPWISPFLKEDELKSNHVPSLAVLGIEDIPLFHKGFDQFVDHSCGIPLFEHKFEGAHAYPVMTKDLKGKIQDLIEVANESNK